MLLYTNTNDFMKAARVIKFTRDRLEVAELLEDQLLGDEVLPRVRLMH